MCEKRLEPLGGGRSVTVTKHHGFGTDALLFSAFAAPKAGERACDLCTGCGIVPLLWHRAGQSAPKETFCLDIQPEAVALLGETVEREGLSGRIHPLLGDLRRWRELPLPRGLDLVTCNPPFGQLGRGEASPGEARRTARQETHCTLEEVCSAAAGLLRFGGRFSLCHRPERLPDLVEALRKSGLEPKRLRFAQMHPQKAPWLVLVEARRGGKPFLQVEPTFLLHLADGEKTPEGAALYRDYEARRDDTE